MPLFPCPLDCLSNSTQLGSPVLLPLPPPPPPIVPTPYFPLSPQGELWGTWGQGCPFSHMKSLHLIWNASHLRGSALYLYSSSACQAASRDVFISTSHSNALFQVEIETGKCVWFPFLASWTRCLRNLPSEILITWERVKFQHSPNSYLRFLLAYWSYFLLCRSMTIQIYYPVVDNIFFSNDFGIRKNVWVCIDLLHLCDLQKWHITVVQHRIYCTKIEKKT